MAAAPILKRPSACLDMAEGKRKVLPASKPTADKKPVPKAIVNKKPSSNANRFVRSVPGERTYTTAWKHVDAEAVKGWEARIGLCQIDVDPLTVSHG